MLNDFDKEEMRAMYRSAADKHKQIGILTELYACSRAVVLDALGLAALKDTPTNDKKAGNTGKGGGVAHAAKSNGNKRGRTPTWPNSVRQDVCKAVLLDGIKHSEASERFGVPYQTVYTWVSAAKQQQANICSEADAILAELAEASVPIVASVVQEQRMAAASASLYNTDGKRVPAVGNPAWEVAVADMEQPHATKQQLYVEPNFEAAVQTMDAEVSLQLRLNTIGDAVNGLRSACHSLADAGLIELPERELLERIGVRATAFRAGMIYAMVREVVTTDIKEPIKQSKAEVTENE